MHFSRGGGQDSKLVYCVGTSIGAIGVLLYAAGVSCTYVTSYGPLSPNIKQVGNIGPY